MKITIKAIKQWLAFILTAFVVITLFGLIFIKTGIVQPSPSFFMELGIVLLLSVLMKIWWYDYTEERRLAEDDIRLEKDKYFTILDKSVQDVNDLDNYLVILNQENKDHFVKNKIGSRTPKNLAEKKWWLIMFHWSWRKLTPEEIGNIRYSRLYYRTLRKADRLKPIKSEQIMALSDSEQLYDARNHLKAKKRTFQVVSTIMSFALTVSLSVMAMEEIMLNWANLFRYIGYLLAMAWTISYTVISAYRQVGTETFDYYSRLKFIVDKYATYKEKEVSDGSNKNRT
jgi:hypothetical protein